MKEKFGKFKLKQTMIMTTAFAGLVTLIFVGSSVLNNSKDEKEAVNIPNIKYIDKDKQEKESFKSMYDDELGKIRAKIKNLESENKDLKKEVEVTKQAQKDSTSTNKGLTAYTNDMLKELDIKVPKADDVDLTTDVVDVNKNPNERVEYKAPVIQTVVKRDLVVVDLNNGVNLNPTPTVDASSNTAPNTAPSKVTASNSEELLNKIENNPIEQSKEEKAPEPKKESKKEDTIVIPAGTFVKSVLLNGADVPTSSNAQSEPFPMALEISDIGNMPNKFKVDIKDCRAISGVYGDLSSETALFRVENLTCIATNGDIYSTNDKSIGYVTGEGGKIGLTGRVVSKQGAILARALASGFVEGVGEMFKQSASTVTTGTNGTTTTIDPNKALQTGLFGGLGKSAEKLSDYYMDLNNKMFSIIEINVGRKCDIIFNKTFVLKKVEL
jgi:conjugal transfer pilus assembly protein TraB